MQDKFRFFSAHPYATVLVGEGRYTVMGVVDYNFLEGSGFLVVGAIGEYPLERCKLALRNVADLDKEDALYVASIFR